MYFDKHMIQHGNKCPVLPKVSVPNSSMLQYYLCHVRSTSGHLHAFLLNKYRFHLNVQFSTKLPFLLSSQNLWLYMQEKLNGSAHRTQCVRSMWSLCPKHTLKNQVNLQGQKQAGHTVVLSPNFLRGHWILNEKKLLFHNVADMKKLYIS